MAESKEAVSRGVLNRRKGSKHFRLSKYHPSAELAFFIEHYWIVRWDLRKQAPFEQEVLSHPSVHLVFEHDNTWIWGVVKGKFTRTLEGKGCVIGIKFRPGGFYPFSKEGVASFSDERLSFNDIFDDPLEPLETDILKHKEDEPMVERAENFLIRHLPEQDPNVEKACRIVERIQKESAILKVDDLVDRFDLSKRSLQRLFRKCVGVSPKWVIQRYRLHEAAEKIVADQISNWTQLALDLGYYDQAHFSKDFKSIVGQTPSEYVKSLNI